MKKRYIVFLLVAGMALVAIITNPAQDQHREAIKGEIMASLQKSMHENLPEADTNDNWGLLGQTLGNLIGGTFVNGIINNLVSSDNYLLFSTTKVTWEGESYIVGIGAFGNVFLTKKLQEVVDEAFLENL